MSDRDRLIARGATTGACYAMSETSAHRGWYLSDPNWPAPNLTSLNNALQQTGWDGEPLTEHTCRPAVRRRLQEVAWEQAVADGSPFLEPTADSGLLTQENLVRLLVGG